MTFYSEKPIFMQLYDRLSDDILAGMYDEEARVPSVREYAATLGVNTNTAMKAYDELSRDGVIHPQRGMGYYVSTDARERIRQHRREVLLSQTLPELFRQVRLLGVPWEEIEQEWRKHTSPA